MSSQLEKYLRDVAVQLHELPEEERDEQVEEIRAHLDTFIEKQKAADATDDEAVRMAIAQFGASAKVGRDIRKAVLRPHLRPVRAAALVVLALATLIAGVGSHFIVPPKPAFAGVMPAFYLCEMLLIGACFGLVLCRNAIRWVFWYFVITGIPTIAEVALLPRTIHTSFLGFPGGVLMEIASSVARFLVTAGGAWIGARFAEHLIRRRRGISR